MKVKWERVDDFYLRRLNRDGSYTWLRGFGPHVGYAKKAISLTKGLLLWGQDGKSGQMGMSNPDVYAQFPNGPDPELVKEVWKHYHELAQQAADNRKNGTAKKKEEQVVKMKRQAKLPKYRTWIVSVDTKKLFKEEPAYQHEDYPELTFTGKELKGFDAKDLYQEAYNANHTNPRKHGDALGIAVFYLKAKEVKDSI